MGGILSDNRVGFEKDRLAEDGFQREEIYIDAMSVIFVLARRILVYISRMAAF